MSTVEHLETSDDALPLKHLRSRPLFPPQGTAPGRRKRADRHAQEDLTLGGFAPLAIAHPGRKPGSRPGSARVRL